jgi:hypothetical protein
MHATLFSFANPKQFLWDLSGVFLQMRTMKKQTTQMTTTARWAFLLSSRVL